MIFESLAFGILLSSSPISNPALPNPILTPGAIDSTKTAAILCAKGYTTKSVRPTAAYTNKLKRQQMKERGLHGRPADFEEDHCISLSLGGNPTDPRNLWPQPYLPRPGAREKDKLEDRLHKCVCEGKLTLKEAQGMVCSNWIKYYLQLAKQECPSYNSK